VSDKVELSLALLIEADEEGEDRDFETVLKRALQRLGRRGGLYLSELRNLLHLPPRVALWRLMNMDEWREAFEEAAEMFISAKLRARREPRR